MARPHSPVDGGLRNIAVMQSRALCYENPLPPGTSVVACGGVVDYVQDAGPSECFVESGKAASEIARNVIPNRDSPTTSLHYKVEEIVTTKVTGLHSIPTRLS